MFSLVATLAFGSFAMANNVELLPVEGVESVEFVFLENNKIISTNSTVVVGPCTDWSMDVWDQLIDAGWSIESAEFISGLVFEWCLNHLY